jgi:hypothetical protein
VDDISSIPITGHKIIKKQKVNLLSAYEYSRNKSVVKRLVLPNDSNFIEFMNIILNPNTLVVVKGLMDIKAIFNTLIHTYGKNRYTSNSIHYIDMDSFTPSGLNKLALGTTYDLIHNELKINIESLYSHLPAHHPLKDAAMTLAVICSYNCDEYNFNDLIREVVLTKRNIANISETKLEYDYCNHTQFMSDYTNMGFDISKYILKEDQTIRL